MSTLFQDFGFSLRKLRRSPGWTAIVVLTLGLGAGVSTTVFSATNAVLLHPHGIPHPDRIAVLHANYTKLNLHSIGVSAPDFADIAKQRQTFPAAALMRPAAYNLLDNGVPMRVHGAQVSYQWFQVFETKPALGRLFLPNDDQPGANHEAVLSYRTWQQRFGGSRNIIGRNIELDRELYQIVGVASADFAFPAETELWTPLGLPLSAFSEDNRFNEDYYAVVRLQDGTSFSQATNAVRFATLNTIREKGPNGYPVASGWHLSLVPFTVDAAGDLRAPLLILFGSTIAVLLLTCANIAGLLLTRAYGQSRDFAIRMALGGGSWAIMRQILSEALLLSSAGAALGVGFAFGALALFRQMAPPSLTKGFPVEVDEHVLVFAIAVAAITGILCGAIPAAQSLRISSHEALRESGRTGTASFRRKWLRSALVVAQTTLSCILLSVSSLFFLSFERIESIRPGFSPDHLLTASVILPEAAYKSPEKQAAFYSDVLRRLASSPGVEAAGAANTLPFDGGFNPTASFEIEGRQSSPGDPGPHGQIRCVTAGFFRSLHVPLLRGRLLDDADSATSQPVAVIDVNLAREYWPGQDPIGKHIRNGSHSPWATIVGITGHVKQASMTGDTGKGIYYYSLLQKPQSNAEFVVRTKNNPFAFKDLLSRAVAAADPAEAIANVEAMQQRIDASMGSQRLLLWLMSAFSALSLILASLGLFGMLSFSVNQRRREIGIRMALGASSAHILRMIFIEGAALIAGGLVLGFVSSQLAGRFLDAYLYGVTPGNVPAFLATAAVLCGAGALASFLPAYRAATTNPSRVLAEE